MYTLDSLMDPFKGMIKTGCKEISLYSLTQFNSVNLINEEPYLSVSLPYPLKDSFDPCFLLQASLIDLLVHLALDFPSPIA